jgi:hypothetical protein
MAPCVSGPGRSVRRSGSRVHAMPLDGADPNREAADHACSPPTLATVDALLASRRRLPRSYASPGWCASVGGHNTAIFSRYVRSQRLNGLRAQCSPLWALSLVGRRGRGRPMYAVWGWDGPGSPRRSCRRRGRGRGPGDAESVPRSPGRCAAPWPGERGASGGAGRRRVSPFADPSHAEHAHGVRRRKRSLQNDARIAGSGRVRFVPSERRGPRHSWERRGSRRRATRNHRPQGAESAPHQHVGERQPGCWTRRHGWAPSKKSLQRACHSIPIAYGSSYFARFAGGDIRGGRSSRDSDDDRVDP